MSKRKQRYGTRQSRNNPDVVGGGTSTSPQDLAERLNPDATFGASPNRDQVDVVDAELLEAKIYRILLISLFVHYIMHPAPRRVLWILAAASATPFAHALINSGGIAFPTISFWKRNSALSGGRAEGRWQSGGGERANRRWTRRRGHGKQGAQGTKTTRDTGHKGHVTQGTTDTKLN